MSKTPAQLLRNDTVNQHFIPQVEQRLNASNPAAARKNQRIFSFRVTDRENLKLTLEDASGRLISSNLSMRDLFSFDVADDDQIRMNLEAHFAQYESDIETQTRSLLRKVTLPQADIKAEIIDLFCAKFLNWLRNPYCIRKMLNSLPTVASHTPTDPELRRAFDRILNGRRPHQSHLCTVLGLSDQDYRDWLITLFLLLLPSIDGQINLFVSLVKRLLEDPNQHLQAVVCTYDDEPCLLSDRGYCQVVPEGVHLSFSFNLCSNAFITYFFTDIDKFVEGRMHPTIVEQIKGHQPKNVAVLHRHNDLAMLAAYNRHVVYQCHERVYCSKPIVSIAAGQ